jgi:hypothetical protein
VTADINCPGAFTVDVVQWMVPDGNEINKNPICLRKHSEGKKGKSVSPFSGKKFTVERACLAEAIKGPCSPLLPTNHSSTPFRDTKTSLATLQLQPHPRSKSEVEPGSGALLAQGSGF